MCTNILKYHIFKLVKFSIIYKSKFFRIKKNRSFLGLLWADIFLRQFIKF